MHSNPDKQKQDSLIQNALNDGSAFDLFERLLEESTHADHFTVVDVYQFSARAEELGPEFFSNHANGILLSGEIAASDNVIEYKRSEVGSLIRYETSSTVEGIILVDYLEKAASQMTLNNAQIVELERLLNKAGKSLGVTLPSVPTPTFEEQREVILHMALEALQAKPKHFHQKFQERMLAAGTPVVIDYKEFKDYLPKAVFPDK